MKVLTPDEMRAVDSRAINEIGIPGLTLMENAGRAVAEHVLDNLPDADLVVIFAGRGNNGGDGLVAARYISENGRDVKVILLKGGKDLTQDCAANLKALPEAVEVWTIDTEEDLAGAVSKLNRLSAGVGASPITGGAALVDAVLGTGIKGQVRGLTADLLLAGLNLNWPTIAVDIPSGIDGTTGEYLGAGIPAIATITMGLPKTGLYLNAGIEYSGNVVVADIGFPPEATEPATSVLDTIEMGTVGRLFADDRSRPDEKALHKGDFGKVLVVAGSRGMLGASELAGRAALRAGCGLVVSAMPVTEYFIVASRTGPEIMTAPIAASDSNGCFAPEGIADIRKYLEWADVLAIGPGFGEHTDALEFARLVISEFPDTPDHQVIVDADALRAFVDDPGPLRGRQRAPILTPHPGEFARLTSGQEFPEGSIDRLCAYAEYADSVIVLKGARTLVATPRETTGCPVSVNCEVGNPGMATAGSGDVLTGILAGLAGQPTITYDPCQIACVGVYLHAFAGDLAAKRVSRQALIAGDIIDGLPLAFKFFSRKFGNRNRRSRRHRRRM